MLIRSRLAANALALPVSDITPNDPTLRGGGLPRISFTVGGSLTRLAPMGCYNAEGLPVQVTKTGQRVEITFAKAPSPGRLRINCTLPAENGRWRWFGRQYLVAP